MQFAEESHNAFFDMHAMKILDLGEELDKKIKKHNDLENACKETVLCHDLKRKYAQNEELANEMKT